MSNLFFVYGTLKAGYGNHRVLRDSPLVGPATSLRPSYFMSQVGFPYLFKGGEHFVSGEVYTVNDADVKQGLDWLEGYPSHYTREVHPFVLADTLEVVDAWVYLNPRISDYHHHTTRRVKADDTNTVTWASKNTVIQNDHAA